MRNQPLSVTHPELASEAFGWDPELVGSGSRSKVIWNCALGHLWEAAIDSRASSGKSGCPTCAGKRIGVGFNDLATTHPELSKEAFGWDPTTVTKGSDKKRTWKCELGHLWETPVKNRASRNRGCPICSGLSVLEGFNDLATTHPEIAAEAFDWDPTKVGKGSGRKVKWKCAVGHNYESSISSRTSASSACPYCAGNKVLAGFNDLSTTHSDIALEAFGWDPREVSKGSVKILEWKCNLGHIYRSRPNSRTSQNHGCPYCSGHQLLTGFNDLATGFPEIAKEAFGWDPTIIGKGSVKKVSWKCPSGHIYESQISSRTSRGDGCPICAGRRVLKGFNDLATTHAEIAAQAVGWDPSTINAGSNKKLRWRCSEGHEWITQPNDRVGGGKGCPTCAKAGFDPNKDGWLYFLQHPVWELFQIGITNNPDKRVGTHIKSGWEVIEIRGALDGHITQQWETDILRMLRKSGAELSPESAGGKFDGYSEAWTKKSFPAKSIHELMELVMDGE